MPDEAPIAYLITFRTYGSWLHGDDRGSVSYGRNTYGTPMAPPNPSLRAAEAARLKSPEPVLTPERRAVVAKTIEEVCTHRGWELHTLAVRTNHAHVVVSALDAAEKVLADLKAWCTRRVREAGLLERDEDFWSYHGSTIYLWKPWELDRACLYVAEGQGGPLFGDAPSP